MVYVRSPLVLRRSIHALIPFILFCAIPLAIPLGVPCAHATTVVATNDVGLTLRADAIIFGSVITTQTMINKQGQIFTQAKMQVYHSLYGSSQGEVLNIQVPGGVLPPPSTKNATKPAATTATARLKSSSTPRPPSTTRLEAVTTGAPKLKSGDIFFSFLEKRGNTYRPLGLSLGVLRARPSGDGTFFLYRDLSGLSLLAPSGHAVNPASQAIQLKDIALETYLKRIDNILVSHGKKPSTLPTLSPPPSPPPSPPLSRPATLHNNAYNNVYNQEGNTP